MRLLLDTHILVWMMCDTAMLTVEERAIITDDESQCTASAVSLWEMRLKWSRFHVSGERKGPVSPVDLPNWLHANRVPILDLRSTDVVAPLDPPLAHTDPFDELLLVQAQQGGYRLLTRDARIAAHPVALVAA